MRTLIFNDPTDTDSKNRWDICYGSILLFPEGFPKETRRVARKILGKFESLAKPIKTDNLVKFELGQAGTIVLEDVEHQLLIDTIDGIRWRGEGITTSDDTLLWLESLEDSSKPHKVDIEPSN
jgi:hypothetical protein